MIRAAALLTPAAVLAGALVQRRHLRAIAEDPEQAVLAEPPSGRPIGVTSMDGTQLHAEVFGPEDGPTFVLGHGWTEMLAYWTYVTQALVERGFRVVAYDLRGHGRSEPAAGGDYSIARFGEDLEALLAHVLDGEDRAIVVGHSLGAMAIVAWAQDHDVARRACAVALCNTGVGELVAESLLVPVPAIANLVNHSVGGARFLGLRGAVPKFSTPISHALMRYTAFGPAATPAQIAFYERMLAACPPDVRADVGIAISEIALSDAVPHIGVPTLVLAGDRDRLTPPSHARRIAEALPNLHRIAVLEQTGHMAPLERPAAVSEALLDLATVATSSDAHLTA